MYEYIFKYNILYLLFHTIFSIQILSLKAFISKLDNYYLHLHKKMDFYGKLHLDLRSSYKAGT